MSFCQKKQNESQTKSKTSEQENSKFIYAHHAPHRGGAVRRTEGVFLQLRKTPQDSHRSTHRLGRLAGPGKLCCIKNENDDENENNESVIPSEERDLASRLGKRLCGTLHLAPCAAACWWRTCTNRVKSLPKARKRDSLVLINQQSSQPTLFSRRPKEG